MGWHCVPTFLINVEKKFLICIRDCWVTLQNQSTFLIHEDAKRGHFFDDKSTSRFLFMHVEKWTGGEILVTFFLWELPWFTAECHCWARGDNCNTSCPLCWCQSFLPVPREERKKKEPSFAWNCWVSLASIWSSPHPFQSQFLDFMQGLGVTCKVLWGPPTETSSGVHKIIAVAFEGRWLWKSVF